MRIRQLAFLTGLLAAVSSCVVAEQTAPIALSLHVEVDSTEVGRDEYILRELVPDLQHQLSDADFQEYVFEGLAQNFQNQPQTDAVGHEPEHVALKVSPVLDLSHMRSAEVERVTDVGDYVVVVALTAEGTDRLAGATAEIIGGRLAVVRNGEVIHLAIVRTAIARAAKMPVYFTSSQADAESLAERINGNVRPR